MSKKHVVFLWIVAAVLGTSAVIVKVSHSKGSETRTALAPGAPLVASFNSADAAKVQITSVKGTTTLELKDGKWTIAERGGYPARANSVSELLSTLKNVKVVDGVEADPSFAPRFGMDASAAKDEDRGTDLTVWDASGKVLAQITVGKQIEDQSDLLNASGGGATGRFVRNHGDTTGFYKVKEMFPSLNAEPANWLRTDFIRVEKIRDIEVSLPGKEETAWKVTRADENADFTLDGAKPGESLDTAAGSPLKSLFSFSSFEDVLTAEEAAEIAKPEEKRTVRLTTFEGFDYTLTLTPAKAGESKTPEDPDMPPPGENFLVTVDVKAELAAERKKDDKESEDDAKAKDQAFATRKAELEKRLAAEQALGGRTFKVSKWTVDALLRERAAMITQPSTAGTPEGPGAANPGNPPFLTPLPGPGNGASVNPPTRRPVEAVTPPIAIPPLDDGDEQPAEPEPPKEEEKPAEDQPDKP